MWILLCLILAAETPEIPEPVPVSEEIFHEVMTFFVRDGGTWYAPNPKAGEPGQPEKYGLEFAWGPHKMSVVNTVFGLNADGSRQDYWLCTFIYQPYKKEVLLIQTGGNGALVQGRFSEFTAEKSAVWMGGALGNGVPFYFKDSMTLKGENGAVSVGYHWVNGQWVGPSSYEWKRAE